MSEPVRSYRTIVVSGGRGRVLVPVPFDPDEAWGAKTTHRLAGTVNGVGIRAIIESTEDGGPVFPLGPAWRRDCGIGPGDEVDVTLYPEGPQRAGLAPDVQAALAADPAAGAFFDALAQFYRRAYLRWIEGTKRRPELRAERIGEMVELLRHGHKQRPGT